MPISCHFQDCKALLVASLTHVSSATARMPAFTFTFTTEAVADLEIISQLAAKLTDGDSNRKSSTPITDGWSAASRVTARGTMAGHRKDLRGVGGSDCETYVRGCGSDKSRDLHYAKCRHPSSVPWRVDRPPGRRNFASAEAFDSGDCKSLRAAWAAWAGRFALTRSDQLSRR